MSCKISSKFGPSKSIIIIDSPPIFLNKYVLGIPSLPSNNFNILYSCNSWGFVLSFDSTFIEYSLFVFMLRHLYTCPNEPPPKRLSVNILYVSSIKEYSFFI